MENDHPQAQNSPRLRILLADDNADLRDYVRRLLGREYDVIVVGDGLAALRSARERTPDLVLTDVMMPGLGGFGLLKELRADDRLKSVPVILLSARAGEESRVEGLEMGADDYLIKPFSAGELLARVSVRLELARMRAQLDQERATMANLFNQLPMPTAVLRGPELIFELANPAYLQAIGGRDILGQPLLKAIPEFRGAGLDDSLRRVMQTGIAQVGHEVYLEVERGSGRPEETYWTFIYAPLNSTGDRIESVIAIWNEVTDQVKSRRNLEILTNRLTAQLTTRARNEQQLAEQARLLDLSNDMIFIRDVNGRITYWNHGAIERYGYTREEAQGRVSHELLRTVFPELPDRINEKFLRDGHWEGELIHTCKDGSKMIALSRWQLDRDAQGNPASVLESNTDITERKRADAERAHLAAIVDSSDDAIISKDLNGIITSWNRGAEKLFGYQATEVIGHSVTILIPPNRIDEEPQILERLRRGERIDHYETVRRGKDGSELDISLTISPIRDKAGKIIGASKVARDITERKRAEALLSRRTAQFETLLNEAPLGVYLVDADFRIRQVNPTALPVFGDIPDLIGRDFGEVMQILWPQAYADEIVQIFRHTLDTGESYVTPERIEKRLDRGVIEYYEWQINRIPLPDGRHGIVCYFRDISIQVRARETIEVREERYRSLVSVITNVLWISDAEGRFVTPQSIWAAYTGQNWDEARGFGWLNAIHPDDREKIWLNWQDCKAGTMYQGGGRLWHAESRQYRYFESRAICVLNSDGSVREWIGACTDVHERKLAEESIRETQAQRLAEEQRSAEQLRRLNRAADEINDATSVEEVLSLTATRARELIGAHLSSLKLVPGGDLEQSQTFSSQSKQYAAWQSHETRETDQEIDSAVYRDKQALRLTRNELGARLIGCLAVPLCDRNDECQGVLRLSDKDEGEFTAADEALLMQLAQTASIALRNQQLYEREQSARLAAEDAARAKDEFIAVVSHELRSPLNSILGWIRLLQTKYGDDPYLRQGMETIERAGRAQLRLIEDLLDTARIISGKLRLEVGPVEPARIIIEAIDTIRPAVESKGVVIIPRLDPEAGQITGDPERLQQVVWNLISNAVKFTPVGGRIEVELRRGPSDVRIIVRDTGEGISSDLLPQIFDRFKQGDTSASRRSGGLGLGLALVKNLVELHGGTVKAESPGRQLGTTFTVSLPVRAVLAKTSSVARSRSMTLESRLTGLRVLVVDDEAEAREMVEMTLTMSGALVTQADSAAAALALIESTAGEGPFDILVCDIGMPDEDGYSLMRKVRTLEDERLRQIPAIALTAFSRTEDRIKALGAGYQMHLAKPVEPEELVIVVASMSGSQV
ncbi:MAG TPA: PAS domain S-box protein [Blastocatellia bacterium]|nr:PAS domain S-box protein [Blastocatellia bacterium]